MAPKKHHGHITFNMAPQDPNGSGGGGGRPKRTTKAPSGMAHPAVTPEMLAAASRQPDTGEVPLAQQFQPVPIVLSKKTLVTLTIPALIAVVTVTGGFMMFYERVKAHMADNAVHLTLIGRQALQTKTGCEKKAKALVKAMSTEIRMSQREIEVKQKEQIQELGDQLSKKQEQRHQELMRQTRQMVVETRRARRAAYGR